MQQYVLSCYHKMYAILLIFVVSFNLVSSYDANVQQLLARVDALERKLERNEMKLATLNNAYEMLLEDRHGQSQCNCSDLEEDIRDIGIIAAKNRHNILVNGDMIQKNEDNIEVNGGLIQTNKDDIEVNAGLILSNKEHIESNLEDNLNSINVS